MSQSSRNPLTRRRFLTTAATAASLAAGASGAARAVWIVLDPADPVAGSAPGEWAAKQFEDALSGRGVVVHRCQRASQVRNGDLGIVAAGLNAPIARELLDAIPVPAVPELLVLAAVRSKTILLAGGYDVRGLVYALLELADRVETASDPLAALAIRTPVAEQPANRVRSVARLFTSDVEDKPWFNDREMWPRYLTMLAAQRFNRFQLALGIGYDFLREVTDAYFLFSYPFLLSVPGYQVRVPQLSDAERDRNLAMLRFISEQTAARGLEFQLGLWMHGYEWINSPHPNYTVEGLTAATHGPYCRDAVCALLKACPAVTGVTFRVHGESGVEEGSYDFWKAVFSGVAACGRKVEIDMHAKGMDQTMIDLAVASGLPVKISPKYWGEHLGMPYHQADIRELERPRPSRNATGLMKLSAGSRSFLRYGYGDLLSEDRKYGVLHRIWPGTQRVLIWGDPLTASAHSRNFGFCGSEGAEIMEPLSFKGRRGSGIAGDRCAYADASLRPRWDWVKYLYSYRVWGRMLYNPAADPGVWQRPLQQKFGAAAPALEAALTNCSRILPIITTAHAASAGNNTYWPEVYLNHSMIDADHPGPYTDSPTPRVFGNVSPLDPQLFSRINDFADELLAGERKGTYSPIEVAHWIENYAAAAAEHLASAQTRVVSKTAVEFRRYSIDIAIQCGLGRFFGAKFRSGVLYRIYEKTGSRAALEQSLTLYRSARARWAELAETAKGVYLPDITVGELPQLRGHWLDRLPAIDRDIEALTRKLETAAAGTPDEKVLKAIQQATGTPVRPTVSAIHSPPARYQPGQPIALTLSVEQPAASAVLYYRHVNQAERYETVPMEASRGAYTAIIPAAYTEAPYPLQYYFEVNISPSSATVFPGFGADLTGQPYFVVRRA